MARIFLSYRRNDTADVVGRIRERLVDRYGQGEVFTDVDSIPVGVNFHDYISSQIEQCEVLIATIGPDWIGSSDESGRYQIENSDDFVRIEICTALTRGIPIIPVLARGATMPSAEQLPDDIKPLTHRNGVPIRPDPDFNNDISRLMAGISGMLGEPGSLDPGSQPPAEHKNLVQQLRALRDLPDVDELPLLFDCLAHDDPDIRRRAMQVVQKIGWPRVKVELEAVASSGSTADIDRVLNGLASIEASRDTLNILERLSEILKGDHRNRVFSLTERKRLSLQMDDVARLFNDRNQRYEFIRVLGQGQLAASYLARHRHTGREAVIRVLRPELAIQDEIRTRSLDLWNRSTHYVHEALALARDVGRFDDERVYFCVRDYIEGETLQQILSSGHRFSVVQASTILRRIAAALTPIHAREECHGGIKPSNVFMSGDHAVLGDTSLPSLLVPPVELRLVNDYPYASPESFHPGQLLAPQSDYYALGCLAYELLSGTPPFVADDVFELAALHRTIEPPALIHDGRPVSSESQRILMHLLAKSPGDRPGDVSTVIRLLDDLENSLRDNLSWSGSTARHETESTRVLRPDRTRISMDSLNAMDINRTILPTTFRHPDSAVVESAVQVGRVLRGRFVLEEVIGSGGMGKVFKARDLVKDAARDRNPYLAIKVLAEDVRLHEPLIRALQREASRAQYLAHPNILTVFDFDTEDGEAYMTMELLQGVQLDEIIRGQKPSGMDSTRAFAVLRGVASGLAYAHAKGLVHSDLKPSNIFVTDDGTAKIFDFGIARAAKREDRLAQDATIFDAGVVAAMTPTYASREMIEGSDPDPRDDVYSLACTAYELLAGHHPFDGLSATEAHRRHLVPRRIPTLSRSQNRALRKALAFSRDERTTTVDQFISDLTSARWFNLLFG